MDGDQEIQQGYLPNLRGPVGTKLRREATEKPTLVMQWLSEAGQTTMRQIATKWGVPAEATGPFLERLFAFLVERALLVPVRLKGARGGPLPNVSGVYQVNADRLLLSPNRSVWRCRSCRRATTRETPHDRCPAWRCDGILEWVREDEDNYDLQLLDGAYSMLRSEEHTAMVPTDERERLENLFKGASEAVNCLVCTPTLELGIDIGRLDSVLMRNVPPLPANYRQRAGRAFRWGPQRVQVRRGVRLRLVNVGASGAVARDGEIGYPVCTVCGQSVSPLASDRQREVFRNAHEERCGRAPKGIGFHADVTADVFSLPACDSSETAYSVLEALRFGAARVLDMHMDDLQILVIGYVDRDDVDALLWDPMAGGSGLLDQLCERFEEVVQVAREVADTCPGLCESSCIDCLQTFRNAYYHGQLNRAGARERIDEWGRRLSFDHEIPRQQPDGPSAEHAAPVNDAEVKLRHLLLAAGFGKGIRGEQIRLDRALGTTTPDVIYRAENDDPDESVCIYLDGLSEHLHGNRETAEKDREIRTWLRNRGYEVVEIAANELDDEDAMVGHFRRLASYLSLPDVRRRVREDRSWFRNPAAPGTARRPRLRLVMPQAAARHVDCVPLVPLEAAAGAFGDPHTVPDESGWDWVEVETTRSLRRGMFVAHVVGQSMEPAVPDGSYCLFASPVTGARQGRTVLVQLHDTVDPDTGDRFTVKRYRSEKTTNEDGWRHVKIVLDPVNPDFEPIELTTDDEESVTVVAELVEVIGPEPPAGEPAES